MAAAFATYGEATALDLSADGTCLVASFEEDEAIRRAEAHPLHAVGDDLVLWVSPQVEMSRSDEWATHGTQSLRFASADPQTGIQVAVVDPDWEFSDWSRFSRFEMDLMVVADQPGGVEVHVMDDISGAHGRAPLFRGHAPPHEAVHISYDIGRRGLARQKHPQSECFIGPLMNNNYRSGIGFSDDHEVPGLPDAP